MSGETFDQQKVRDAAVQMDERTTVAEIVLQASQTAWNPLSAKGPLYGPQIVKYVMTRADITVGLYKLGQCVGAVQIRPNGAEHYEWRQCTEKIGKTATRCDDHKLVSE